VAKFKDQGRKTPHMQTGKPVFYATGAFIFLVALACTDTQPKTPAEGVHADGNPVAGYGLSAGLDEDPFSEPTEEVENSQQEYSRPEKENLLRDYEVTVSHLNTRKGPGKNFQILTILKKGDVVKVSVVDDKGWAKLQDGSFCSVRHLKQLEEGPQGREKSHQTCLKKYWLLIMIREF